MHFILKLQKSLYPAFKPRHITKVKIHVIVVLGKCCDNTTLPRETCAHNIDAA